MAKSTDVQQLDERLKREGIKTHKERVEELNRYLSNLSEHHDMYVFLALRLLKTAIISGHKRASAGMKMGVRTGPISSWALEELKNAAGLSLIRISIGPESDQDNGVVVSMSGQSIGWWTIRLGNEAQQNLFGGWFGCLE